MHPLIDVTNTVEKASGRITKALENEPGRITENKEKNKKKKDKQNASPSTVISAIKFRNQKKTKCGNRKNGSFDTPVSDRNSSHDPKDLSVLPYHNVNKYIPSSSCIEWLLKAATIVNMCKLKLEVNIPLPNSDLNTFSEFNLNENLNEPPKEYRTNSAIQNTYRCLACGSRFYSVNKLTPHLIKHIYEGLNAALWLNQAITTTLDIWPSQEHRPSSNSSASFNRASKLCTRNE